jgi:hypothetical protein
MLPGTSMLSLPSVTEGVTMTFPGSELVFSEAFSSHGEPLVVAVHQRNASLPPTNTPTNETEGTN